VKQVQDEMERSWEAYVGHTWEMLAREVVCRMEIGGRHWKAAARWWGGGLDRRPLEVDVVAASTNDQALLVGEAKLRIGKKDVLPLRKRHEYVAKQLPFGAKKPLVPCVFALHSSVPCEVFEDIVLVTGEDVIGILK